MVFQVPQGGQAGSHGQRVSGKGSRLVDRTQRRDQIHDLSPAAVSAHRQAPADDLAQRGQVRLDSIELLRAAKGQPEAGHDFVKDQRRSMLGRDVAEELQVMVVGRDTSHIAHDRLYNQAGNLPAESFKGLFHRFLVVEGQRQGKLRQLLQHAG